MSEHAIYDQVPKGTYLIVFYDGWKHVAEVVTDISQEAVTQLCKDMDGADMYVSSCMRLSPEQIESSDYRIFIDNKWHAISELKTREYSDE